MRTLQKREKLKALLVRKFRMKYGNSPKMDAAIVKAVKQFVSRKRVTEQDLESLGRKVEAAAKQLGKLPIESGSKPTPTSKQQLAPLSSLKMVASSSAPVLENSLAQTPKPTNSKKTGAVNATLGIPKAGTGQIPPPGTPVEEEEVPEDWTLIARFQLKKQEEARRKELRAVESRRKRTISSYEEQIEARKHRLRSKKDLDTKYFKSVKANMKKWKLEEDEKKRQRALAIKIQQEERAKQVKEKEQRIAREKKERLKYETDLVNRIERENELQEQREKHNRRMEKKRLADFLAGNAEHKKIKAEQKRKEREDDITRMNQYAKILEEQEQRRSAYFKGRADRMKKFADKNVEARKQEFENTKAIELRNLRYMKEIEDKQQKAERDKQQWRRKNQKDINEWLNKAIAAKAEAREREKSMYLEINEYAKKKAAEVSRNHVMPYP